MLPPITQTLRAAAAVTAIIGSNPIRCYRHGEAPQKVDKPYVTWFLVNGDPENSLSDAPSIDRMTVQIDCWHQTDAGIEQLASAVRAAIEPHAHITGMPINTREPETRLYRIALQLDWWLQR